MKKILHVVEAFEGGVFTYLQNILEAQCNEYDVYVAHGTRNKTPNNFRELFDKRVHFIAVRGFCREINFIQDIEAFCCLKQIQNIVKPDVIHLHSSKAGAIGRYAFCGKKLPLFYSPHGYSFLMQDCGRMKATIYKTIERIIGKRACVTIADGQSEYERGKQITSHIVKADNGINTHRLEALLDDIHSGQNSATTDIKVFMLGRITYAKNPERFNRIAQRFPNVSFIWIGDGELRSCLTSTNIIITGWKNRLEALKLVKAADVFLFTTLWESLSVALLEAMYLKRICIVSDVDGNHDVIRDKRNGILCKTDEDFVQALTMVINHEIDVAAMTEAAFHDVQSHYNTDNLNKRLLEVYENYAFQGLWRKHAIF